MARSARPPALARLPRLEMPTTTVRKMIGAVTILIRFTNRSASHLEPAAACGNTRPNTMPSTMAAITQKYSWPYQGLRAVVDVDMPSLLYRPYAGIAVILGTRRPLGKVACRNFGFT